MTLMEPLCFPVNVLSLQKLLKLLLLLLIQKKQ